MLKADSVQSRLEARFSDSAELNGVKPSMNDPAKLAMDNIINAITTNINNMRRINSNAR